MNNNETDHLHSGFQHMGLDPSYFEDEENEENDDPILYITQQLSMCERYVLYHYKHQKLVFAEKALHPDDIAMAVQDEAYMYEFTFGISNQIEVLTPYDDYLYLRDELLKNPFEVAQKPEELLLAYMFCLCKDTREELWQGHIEKCQTNVEYIGQLYIRIQDLLRNLHELWLRNPDELPVSHDETAYYSPVSNQIRYKIDPDYDNEALSSIGRKKTTQLTEWHQYQFKQLLKTATAKQKEKWKTVSAAINAVIDEFEQRLSEQAEQNIQTFERGRYDFAQFYQLTAERLQSELDNNAWLIDHSINQERRELAEQKMKYLKLLIKEQNKLINSKEEKRSLIKDSYSTRTLTSWINDDPELRNEIILPKK
ncbi:hypothetical protein ABKPCSM17A_02303 [Acinetobacter baumannii]|uniref:hypothetical protein n=1 Tax=Acinetobacter baumannii TaxID=470 RepID=UPI00135FE8A4|nr:hypothetical protein [Acinetobacter baumannii]MDC5352841.1 hypothetical protein [Acinetobacter baumannii]CAA0235026.1 hypothetical protein ABKPCSM17A_02303 [Acinetobacter baumannii]